MTAAYSVRYAIALGLAYVFLVLAFYAGFTVGHHERNVREAQRIAKGYGVGR